MLIPIASLPDAPVTDACAARIFGLPDPVVGEMMRRPLSRRLAIHRAGCYVDTHHHGVDVPGGFEATQLFVCTAGSGWVRVGRAEHVIVPGTAFVIPRDEPYAYAGTQGAWTLWWCSLIGTDVDEVLAEVGMTAEHPVATIGNLERLVAVIDDIIQTYDRDTSPHEAIEASGAGWQLISRLDAGRTATPNADPLARAVEYLSERYRANVRVPELSAAVGVPPAKLAALFREATGGGVLSYIIGLRMTEARRLLAETSLTVGEVATAVGYDDPYYFSREFRRRHGMTPSGCRRLGGFAGRDALAS
jgi:AraC family transcriptional regulator of arabinose operon